MARAYISSTWEEEHVFGQEDATEKALFPGDEDPGDLLIPK